MTPITIRLTREQASHAAFALDRHLDVVNFMIAGAPPTAHPDAAQEVDEHTAAIASTIELLRYGIELLDRHDRRNDQARRGES